MKRVAAVGLDGAEWTLIERMLEDGELPHLSSLRGRSAVARLRDPADYRTGLVWEHFLTGKSAEGNRRWSAVEFDPGSYGAWQVGGRKIPPFYAQSGSSDGGTAPPIATIAFDVPYVSLTGRVKGVEITAWGGHDAGYPRASRPPGLLREIDARFGPHPAFENDYEPVWYRPALLDAMADALIVGARRRADASLWLQRRLPEWELFLTVMSEAHSAGEHMWHGIDRDYPLGGMPTSGQAGRRLREVYRALDDAVGRMHAGLPAGTALIVFSMHGMGANHADLPSMVLLPELLHRMHFGRAFLRDPSPEAWTREGFPPLVPDADRSWQALIKGRRPDAERAGLRRRIGQAVPGSLRDAYRATRGTRAVSRAPKRRVGALGRSIDEETELTPEEIGEPRHALDWQIPCLYRPFWPQMRAFALPTFYDGRVRINLQGRERDGVVPADAYRSACHEIEAIVRACRNPRTGRPVVADVAFPRADDPFSPDGPDADVVIIWTDAPDALEHPDVGVIGPFPFRRTGGHSSRGFAFVSGPEIETQDLGERHALDVTPTILALLGREPPPDLEGTPLVTLASSPAPMA